jgi:NADH-quinone oxidoreductase subunit L
MMLGWLAICGIAPWAGFFSKDEILYKTFSAHGMENWNYALWIVGVVTALLTAIYMTRLMVMTFWSEERINDNQHDLSHGHDDDSHDDGHAHHGKLHPHESPWTMTVPLIILAFLSTVGGLVGIPSAISSLVGAGDVNVFEHILEPVVKKVEKHEVTSKVEHKEITHATESKTVEHKEVKHEEHSAEAISTERLLAVFSLGIAILGIVIGFVGFKNNPLRQMPKLFENKWFIDEIYNKGIINPLTNLSRNGLWKGFDVGFIDGMVNGIGSFISELGGILKGVQVGFVRSYAAIILFGALIVIGYFVYFGLKLLS